MDADLRPCGIKTLMEYTLLKLVHIGSLVFWLGPALGAWLVLKFANKETDYSNPVAARVSRMFFFSIVIEHVAFVVLLTTGFTLAIKYQMMGVTWLNQKLYIIMLVVIPLEVVDVLLGNWLASNAEKKLYQGRQITSWEQKALNFYHGLFTKLALILIPTSVLAIMYLVIGKTAF